MGSLKMVVEKENQGLPGRPRKKAWQRKGGLPRLKGATTARKKGRPSVEQELKVLKRLHLQAIKDLRQALRNARQFEVRKVCRRIRAQEEKCAEVAGKDAAAAAALHKGLAKLSGQREALKVVNLPVVLRRVADQAGVPLDLLREAADADPPAGDGNGQEWAVARLLAAHCVQQACEKVRGELEGQKRAVEAAQRWKDTRVADRRAKDQQGPDGAGGLSMAGHKRKAGELVGLGEDGAPDDDMEAEANGASEDNEDAAKELAERALERLREVRGHHGAADSGDDASSSGSEEGQPVDDLDVSSEEGRLGSGAELYDDLSLSESGSEEEEGSGSGRGLAGAQKGPAPKQSAKKPKKKNRLGQRERKRLAAAAALQVSQGPGRSSKRPMTQGPRRWATGGKQQGRTKAAAHGDGPQKGTRWQSKADGRQVSSLAVGERPSSKVHSESAKKDLHPSWAAKKAEARVIAPFAGKKVIFDEEGQKKVFPPSQGLKFTDKERKADGSGRTPKGELEALHPSWAAKRSQTQKLSVFTTSSVSKKVKFDD